MNQPSVPLMPICDRLEIPLQRHRILFGSGVLFATAGAAGSLFAAIAARDVATAVFGVCCAIFAALSVVNLRHRPGWIFTREGLTWMGPAGSLFYGWRQVGDFSVGAPFFFHGTINFDFAPERLSGGWDLLSTRISQALSGSDRSLLNNTAVPTTDLVRAMNTWREACSEPD
jgi:hypothetical protein